MAAQVRVDLLVAAEDLAVAETIIVSLVIIVLVALKLGFIFLPLYLIW